MAKGGETVGSLYLRLHLDWSELNQDFINVEETLSANIQRLNRQSTLIDLKANIDLTGVTDAEQKLKIEQEKLTKQIELQTQKVKLYETQWINAYKANGLASKQAENAAVSFKRQELELARLSQRLKEVTEQQKQMEQTKTAQSNFDNSLLGRYTNLKGNIAGDLNSLINSFTGITDATSSADAAITKSLEIIGNIPHPVGKAVAALASIPLVAKGIENSLLDMAKPAIAAGDAMYVMSRGMQLSIADAAKLNTICKVTGIEISEVNSAMRRLSASLEKSGDKDNAALKMLRQFGADVKDANGHIKNEIELIGELSKALKNAEAVGQGAAFRDIVGGRFWSGDFITFLEDYEGNVELAGKIVKNGLANPVLAHEVQGNLNAMNTQIGQFKGALSSAFMPATQQLVPELTQQFGELTKVVADNAEGIKNVSMAIGEVIGGTSRLTTEIAKLGANAVGVIGGSFTSEQNRINTLYANLKEVNSAEELMRRELQRRPYTERIAIENNPALQQQTSSYYKDSFKNLEKFREEINKTKKSWADFRKELDTKIDIKALSDDSLKRIESYSEELEHLKIALAFGKDDYGKSLAELDLWYRKAAEQAKEFEKERTKLAELYSAKRLQIEQAHNEQIQKSIDESQQRSQSLMNEVGNLDFNRTHSPFEQRIREIQQWEQTALESLSKYKDALKDTGQLEQEAAAITANSLAKQREAFEREMDRIKGNVQSLKEKIFEQEHSQRDIDVMRAQKQRAEYLNAGNSQEDVERWYQNELAKIGQSGKGADYYKTPNLPRESNSGFQTMYGDVGELPKLPDRNFFGEIQQETERTVNEMAGLAESTKGLSDAQATFKQQLELIEGDSLVSSFTTSVDGVVDAQDHLAQATRESADKNAEAGEALAQALRDTAQNLSQAGVDLSTQADQQQSSIRDYIKAAADVLEMGGGAAAVAGGATMNPVVAAGGGIAGLLGMGINKGLEWTEPQAGQADYANSAFNTSELQQKIQDFQNSTSELLSRLSDSVSAISENVNKISSKDTTPNVTVSPNINIDLGGAYVFDDSMKQQLTDDITQEVANAVKSAVQSATSQADYGYGN